MTHLPGVSKDSLDVKAEDDTPTIRGTATPAFGVYEL